MHLALLDGKCATCVARSLKRKEKQMKDKIHPVYKDSTIVCACGETIHTRSTKPSIRVEICSKCHPFFTGKQKFIDSAGRVDKFLKKYGKK
jgi:large subunit ribosomal protein L31